jgi:hypothetical protein
LKYAYYRRFEYAAIHTIVVHCHMNPLLFHFLWLFAIFLLSISIEYIFAAELIATVTPVSYWPYAEELTPLKEPPTEMIERQLNT